MKKGFHTLSDCRFCTYLTFLQLKTNVHHVLYTYLHFFKFKTKNEKNIYNIYIIREEIQFRVDESSKNFVSEFYCKNNNKYI